VADTGDGELAAGEATTAAITQLAVIFDEEVRDPGGDGGADDVTNPANYLLFGPGADGTYETVDCAAGVVASDTAMGIDEVIYDAGENTAYLKIAAGTPLARGRYRLHACGTTSILDPAGNELDGDADGSGGDDFARSWSVTVDQLLANPNFDVDFASWAGTTPGSSTYGRSTDDAAEAPTSGSAEVVNVDGAGDFELAADCVELGSETGLFLNGNLRVADGVGADPGSWLQLSFYDDAGCTGTLVAQELPAITTGETAGAWPRLQGWADVPAGAVSVRAAFGTAAGAATGFTAGWDSASLFQMLYGNGFESGDTQGWSSSTP
jgi:hypothetical protein